MKPRSAALRNPGRTTPKRVLALSMLALSIPLAANWFLPGWTSGEGGVLIWLLALIPPFLLSYHRGWQGASTALAAGMAAYALGQVLVVRSGFGVPSPALLLAVTSALILVSLGAGAVTTLLNERIRQAEDLALTDTATGLPNQRHAMLHLGRAYAAAARGDELSVVVFEVAVDQVNHRWGRSVTNEVLRQFAELLAYQTRSMHLSARLSGGTFLAVLDGIGIEGAVVFAEKVLAASDAVEMPWGALKVCCGVAAHDDKTKDENVLLAAAEQALHRAKSDSDGRSALGRADRGVDGGEPLHPRRSAAASLGAGETILVVDDDTRTLRVLTRVLQRAGYRTLSAATPEQAERLAKESLLGVDLVVTDVVMPGMDGFQLVDRIQAAGGPGAILYLFGYGKEDIQWRRVPGEPKAFLSKPVDMKEILATVRALLDRESVSSPDRTVA